MDSTEVCIELLSQGIQAVWMMDSGNSQASVLPFLHQQLQQEAQRRVNKELSLPHHTAALFSWCCFHDNRFPRIPVMSLKVMAWVWDVRARGTFLPYQYDLKQR